MVSYGYWHQLNALERHGGPRDLPRSPGTTEWRSSPTTRAIAPRRPTWPLRTRSASSATRPRTRWPAIPCRGGHGTMGDGRREKKGMEKPRNLEMMGSWWVDRVKIEGFWRIFGVWDGSDSNFWVKIHFFFRLLDGAISGMPNRNWPLG